VPERRGLPESTRSISDQPGGPLLKPTQPSLSNICSIAQWPLHTDTPPAKSPESTVAE
jgi:hypothetical protein